MVYAPLSSPSFLFHALGLVLTVMVSLVVARWVVRQSRDAAAWTMVGLLLVHVTVATLLLVQLVVEPLEVKAALSALWYGIVLANPVLWFVFSVYYTGNEHWLTSRVKAVLCVSALVPFSVVVTNPYHHLLVTDWTLRTEPFRFQQAVVSDLNGPFFVLVMLYVLAGFALLFRLSLLSRRSSRWQSVGLLVGMLAVQVPAFLSFTELVPIKNFPYGIYGAGVFGVIVALSLFRSRLFAVAPLARDALFDSLDDAVVVVDPEQRLVDYNERALALFPEFHGQIGQPIDEYYPELVESEGATDDTDGDVLQDDEMYRSTTEDTLNETGVDAGTRFVDPIERTVDGAVRSYNVTTSAIERGGKLQGYGIVVSDVTTLVDYATELERKTERLEQFASVLSHDLRNPVTVAVGRIQLERDEEDSENLRTTLRALERIEATIDDLLTLARSGETVTHPEWISLTAVVEDAWKTSDTGEATLTLAIDDGYRIYADSSRLATLLENLFRNAADHGGVHVTAGTIEVESGEPVGFFVADDGPGIPPDEREKVFEYGYTTTGEGTGFGLAIVKSVADAHDWSVTVRESKAGGARFEMRGTEILASSDALPESPTESVESTG